MTLMQLLSYGPGAASILAIVLTLIQLSPLEFNPWACIGNAFNKELKAQIKSLEGKVEKLEKKIGEVDSSVGEVKETIGVNAALQSRTNILHFGDELLMNPDQRHTKEHFDQILRDCDTYEDYCSDHPKFENNQAVLTVKRIKEIYAKCLEKHDFLV